MISKTTICLAVLLAAACAVPIEYQHQQYQEEEYNHPAEYEFSYAVHDEHTGDIKSQKEQRKGYDVQGQYELVEPDGHKRTVHYTANKGGFNAVVHREPTKYRIPEPQQHYKQITYSAAPLTHQYQTAQLGHYGQTASLGHYGQTSQLRHYGQSQQQYSSNNGHYNAGSSSSSNNNGHYNTGSNDGHHYSHVNFHSDHAQFQY